MITAADLQTLSDATLDLYSPELDAANWVEHSFKFITKLVSADMVNYGNLDPAKGTLEATTTCERSSWPTAVTGFGQFMKKYSFFCFDPTVNEGRPFFSSDFVSARQFQDLDIYSECFRILETRDHAAVHVATGDGKLAWFAAERGGRGHFSERDRLMLTLGQQHLVNSFKLALARQRSRDERHCSPAAFCEAGFTPREAEVACWLIEGKTNVEIALLLKLQPQTVKGHVTALFNKTGSSNRLALTLHLMDLAGAIARARKDDKVFRVQDWTKVVL